MPAIQTNLEKAKAELKRAERQSKWEAQQVGYLHVIALLLLDAAEKREEQKAKLWEPEDE